MPLPILDLRLLTEGTRGRQGLQRPTFSRADLTKNLFLTISSHFTTLSNLEVGGFMETD